jgi:hypothetical protein
VGEYARTSGIYDPVDVLEFTRLCIDEAIGRLGAHGSTKADVLLREVLGIASVSCGVRKPPRGDSMDVQETENVAASTNACAAATASFVASVSEQKPVVAVPASHERSMPPQQLGELPDVRPATLWSSFTQTVRRSTWSLFESMFVRSE